MQNIVDAVAGGLAIIQTTDVPFDEVEALPLSRGHCTLDLGKVVAVTGGEVVHADDFLVKAKQCFQQV